MVFHQLFQHMEWTPYNLIRENEHFEGVCMVFNETSTQMGRLCMAVWGWTSA